MSVSFFLQKNNGLFIARFFDLRYNYNNGKIKLKNVIKNNYLC